MALIATSWLLIHIVRTLITLSVSLDSLVTLARTRGRGRSSDSGRCRQCQSSSRPRLVYALTSVITLIRFASPRRLLPNHLPSYLMLLALHRLIMITSVLLLMFNFTNTEKKIVFMIGMQKCNFLSMMKISYKGLVWSSNTFKTDELISDWCARPTFVLHIRTAYACS